MIQPLRTILSPVDFSENSLAAVEYAAYFARQSNATVYLLYVIEELRLPAELYHQNESGIADLGWAEKTAKEKLQAIAREHLGQEMRYEILARVGDPATVILAIADHIEAELIVIATHGRKGLAHLILGSVAEKVMRESLCPVLTIRR